MESCINDATLGLSQELQAPVETWFERLRDQHAVSELPADQVEPLVRLVACSEFAAGVVLQNWQWFLENVASFSEVPGDSEAVLESVADSALDADALKSELRRIRNRTLLRILWREIFSLADLDETLGELSGLADSMLDVATRSAMRLLAPRYGHVRDSRGQRVPMVILGMGKLGGRELNFSSDIDLIFLFSEDGETDGARSVSAQEYFGRLSRLVIALLDEVTVDGFAFRIDTRLRPFGDSGPPVVSFAALESYLLQHGRDWERYAYIKARVVGPDPGQDVREDINNNLIRPFVYRRYIDYGVFESLREMHAMIAAEVRRRELSDNVKLGPGGIREAEFIVQSFQLVRGGSETALQGRELQKVLPQLVSRRGLSARAADLLREAYRFLRRLENFIQGIRDQQTHDLPRDETDRARLCLAMGYADWDALRKTLDQHREAIVAEFDRVAFRGQNDDTPLRQQLARAWESDATEEHWRELLHQTNTKGAADLAARLVSFASAAAIQQIDAIAADRLHRFIPELIMASVETDAPLLALTRTLDVVARILRRSAYLALLNENGMAMTRLVDLCARSQYIADQIARNPVLLDELLDPRIYSASVTKSDLSAELKQRLATVEPSDGEAQMLAIVEYQRATMFRIAVADFHGSLPIMKVSDGLTWLAESVLDEALRVAWQDLTARHGVPCYVVDGVKHEAGLGIVGYGKLGGLELSYGSDLDIVFLHDSRGESRMTDGEKPLDNLMFFARLVKRLVLFLTTQTGSGELYEIDTRLRPDGHKGLLVTSTEAFERYQEDNAWTWEHQALLRARAVAGSNTVAREFERIRKDTLVERVRRETLRDDVIGMRQKMRKELDRTDGRQFDLKHGAGGIGDIEFLVQYLVLSQAKAHPDVIFYSDNIRQLDALAKAGCIEPELGDRLQDCYRRYRLRQHHLVLDDDEPLAAAEEFVQEREFVTKVWAQWLD
ncbi:MAG: bifunctional [glutamate--ammonia ligase]-adenylyl-L-tyrosine phosphorylase/[glutamate--ammonia-ligase] adenylyltransferase [Gammaproteobacteria bacterium]|nr:bifunctional [glutamate--ammonia ligase]-adenylyl-L-tyrosine phosphorylase/[glutamate--ammonia-ligase] adenylyltransferase [Gammaproteobacteria bacterium]